MTRGTTQRERKVLRSLKRKKEVTAEAKKTKIKVLGGHTRKPKSRRRIERARFLIQQALTQDKRR